MASQFTHDLQSLLDRLKDETLTLGDLLEETSDRSFSLLIALLVLPFLVPSIPGFTTLPSLACLLLSLQIAMGRSSPWLPPSIQGFKFPPKMISLLLGAVQSVSKVLDRITRPRMSRLVQSPPMRRFNGCCLAWMSLLLMSPVPFTNPLFTVTILLFTTAMLEGDGLLLLVAYGLMGLETAVLGGGLYLLWQAPELLQQIQQAIVQFWQNLRN